MKRKNINVVEQRSLIYSYLSGCNSLYDDNWLNEKVDYTYDRLKRSVELLENLILLIIGEPSCGKTYIIRATIKKLLKVNNNVEVIELYTHYYKDDIKCMQALLSKLEELTGSLTTKGINHVVSELQSRMLHCLKYLKTKGTYVIIVIDGLERFTRGIYDCSSSAGSCRKRQGLLYFLGDSIQLKDTSFSLICITSDLKATERFEKRVKSRFVHESVYCYNNFDVKEYIDNIPISDNLKAILHQEHICGKNSNYFVMLTTIANCLSAYNTADISVGDTDLKGNCDKDESITQNYIKQVKKNEYISEIFQQLNIPEHYILISLTRLHCKGVYPQTFVMIENDVNDMIKFYPQEKHTIPQSQALKRAFFRLVSNGIIEWVNYTQNNIGGVSVKISANDALGTTIPCRFPLYKM